MTTLDDEVLTVAALKVISDFTRRRYDEAKAGLTAQLHKGERKIARSPLGDEKIGAVYVTDPDPVCAVVDGPALRDWIAEHYPALIEQHYELIGSEKELIDVLFQHAPHLLRPVSRVTGEALRELKANCVTVGAVIGPSGEADVPGLSVHIPDGVVTCRPDRGGLTAVMALHQSGRLELDGTLRPEIEAP